MFVPNGDGTYRFKRCHAFQHKSTEEGLVIESNPKYEDAPIELMEGLNTETKEIDIYYKDRESGDTGFFLCG